MTDHFDSSDRNPTQPETPTPSFPDLPPLEASTCTFEAFDYLHEENEYRAKFDAREVSPSIAVIEAVALLSEKDPIDLEPIQSVIDSDALDTLLSRNITGSGDLQVTFDFEIYTITMRNYGSIVLRPGKKSIDTYGPTSIPTRSE